MRHGKSFNHLGRKTPHRQAMLSNMASSLIQNKRITTTVAKAKALRRYVEPILTKSKDDTTNSRRVVFSYLQDKESVQVLFNEVAAKIADRPGGYTRIIKLAETRLGDSSEMCIIELVDYNDLLLTEEGVKKTRTRRGRRGGGSKQAAEATETTAKAEKAPKAEAKSKEKPEAETKEKPEAKAEEKVEAKEAKEEPKASEPTSGTTEGTESKTEGTSGEEEKKEGKE